MIFVSWDGDNIGQLAGRARLDNNVEECRRISNLIEYGNKIFESFAIANLGKVGSSGGDEGFIEIPPDQITQIPKLAQQYIDLTGCTVTVGVGMTLSESSKALLVGKLRSKAQLVIWQPEMEAEVQLAAQNPISEQQKQHDAYLGNEDGDGLNKSADPARVQQILEPQVPRGQPSLPAIKAPPEESPQPQEQAPSVNYEDEFHGLAQRQGEKDLFDDSHKKERLDQIKKDVIDSLNMMREQLPAIAQLQQTAPEAYQSILALINGVIELGQETIVQTMPDVNKSEDLSKAISTIDPGKRMSASLQPHHSAEGVKVFSRKFDYSHLLHPDMKNSGFQLHVEHKNTMLPKGVKEVRTDKTSNNIMPIRATETIRSILRAPNGADIGYVQGHVNGAGKKRAIEPHSDLEAPYRGKGLGTAMYEAAYTHAKQSGVNRVEGGVHSPDAHALHTRLSQKHGFSYKSSWANHKGKPVPADEFPYKPYSYALKAEGHEVHEPKEDGFLGIGHGPIFYRDGVMEKDEQDVGQGNANEGQPRRTGANAGGAQAGRAHLRLPVGTTLDGKTKMISGTSSEANWRSVKGGMISSQQDNPPILGANSSATSAKNPDR